MNAIASKNVRVSVRLTGGSVETFWAVPVRARRLGGTYELRNSSMTAPLQVGDIVAAETIAGRLQVTGFVSRAQATSYVLTYSPQQYARLCEYFKRWAEFAWIEDNANSRAVVTSQTGDQQAPGPKDFDGLVTRGIVALWRQTAGPEDTVDEIAQHVELSRH